MDDVQDVSNYVAAMNHALKRLREDSFPLSLRLIKEVHKVLLAKGRGSDKMPGEFRRTQNWLGGTRPGNTRFVPPPPDRVAGCMSNLEKYLHDQPQRTTEQRSSCADAKPPDYGITDMKGYLLPNYRGELSFTISRERLRQPTT